jgi:hypothetical protein
MLVVTSTSAALAAPVSTTDAARMAAILMGVVLKVMGFWFRGAELVGLRRGLRGQKLGGPARGPVKAKSRSVEASRSAGRAQPDARKFPSGRTLCS